MSNQNGTYWPTRHPSDNHVRSIPRTPSYEGMVRRKSAKTPVAHRIPELAGGDFDVPRLGSGYFSSPPGCHSPGSINSPTIQSPVEKDIRFPRPPSRRRILRPQRRYNEYDIPVAPLLPRTSGDMNDPTKIWKIVSAVLLGMLVLCLGGVFFWANNIQKFPPVESSQTLILPAEEGGRVLMQENPEGTRRTVVGHTKLPNPSGPTPPHVPSPPRVHSSVSSEKDSARVETERRSSSTAEKATSVLSDQTQPKQNAIDIATAARQKLNDLKSKVSKSSKARANSGADDRPAAEVKPKSNISQAKETGADPSSSASKKEEPTPIGPPARSYACVDTSGASLCNKPTACKYFKHACKRTCGLC